MARVFEHNLEHEVPDDLYCWFLDETIVEGRSVEDVLASIQNPEHQRKLNNYIIFRLAEVDPGYVTKVMITDDDSRTE